MVFDHLYAAIKITRTGKIIPSQMPNYHRKDEWQLHHGALLGNCVEETLGMIKNTGENRTPFCGCTWAWVVHSIIKEIHPHLKIEPIYPKVYILVQGNYKMVDDKDDSIGFSIKMTKAEFMTSAGIYIDCGDELKQYPDDERLIIILTSGDLMEKTVKNIEEE